MIPLSSNASKETVFLLHGYTREKERGRTTEIRTKKTFQQI